MYYFSKNIGSLLKIFVILVQHGKMWHTTIFHNHTLGMV